MNRPAQDPRTVGIVFGTLGLLSSLAPFLRIAPNRLLTGEPLGPHAVVVLAWAAALALAVARRAWLCRGAVALLAVALPWAAGAMAAHLAGMLPAVARVQLGAGFWLMWVLALVWLADVMRPLQSRWRMAAWALWLVTLAMLAHTGAFAHLSLAQELAAQRQPFLDALGVHVRLALLTLLLALLVGMPVGWLAWRRERAGSAVLSVLSFLQVMPSLALFALLIGPFAALAQRWPALAKLGFGGTGAAPAVTALVLYALLPVVRYTLAGLQAVPADAYQSARALGMTRGQVLLRMQVPLAAPVLLAGMRVVAVQTIGLTAVAALIGAGGLGRFIFLGIGQGASDTVLLGTVSIVVLALLADLVFQSMVHLSERRA